MSQGAGQRAIREQNDAERPAPILTRVNQEIMLAPDLSYGKKKVDGKGDKVAVATDVTAAGLYFVT